MDRFWITFLPFMAIYSGFGIIWLVENKSFGKWYDYGKYFVIIIILILFCIALYKEMHLYNQNKSDTLYYMLNTEGHELIQVETYFDTHNIDSPILVTNPVFAAYSDKRFVGAYDILNKKSLFVNDWESNLDFNAVAYMNSSIPCIISDNYCIENKRQLQDLISEKFIEKDSYIYAGENVTFYVK
jgi:hypothetical protein